MSEKKVILIIDDDPKSVKLERDLLEMADYEVIAVGDAETGIAKAEELAPALIIMDFQLPGMSGELAIKILRDKEKNQKHSRGICDCLGNARRNTKVSCL